MKNLALLLVTVALFSFTFTACKKENKTVNKVIEVTLEPNQAYSYTIPKLGDADDVTEITTAATHAITSTLTPVGSSGENVFNYSPTLDYIGTDVVVVSANETSTNTHSCNTGNHGNKQCGGHHHDCGNDTYTFNINIKVSSN